MGWGVGNGKKWSKSKTRRVFEIATKNKKINFFLDFFGLDFFGPEVSWVPAPLGVGQAQGGLRAER